MRFKGFAALSIEAGQFANGRKRLLDALVKEIDEIYATISDWDRVSKKQTRRTNHETRDSIYERNQVLDSVIQNLRQKAIDISKEYAEFFEKTIDRNYRYSEAIDYKIAELEIIKENFDAALQNKSNIAKTLTETQGSLRALQDVVVAGSELRNQLETHSIETLRHATIALHENRKLRESNEALTERLSYKGPLLSEAKESFLENRRTRGVAGREVAQLKKKIDDFIMLIGDKAVGAYSPSDLQRFARKLTFLPERHTIMPKWRDRTIADIIAENEIKLDPKATYLCDKTILVTYVGKVKTAIRWLCAENEVEYCFRDAPKIVVAANGEGVIRYGLPYETVNRLLSQAARSRESADIWMPVVALLTGARIGELVFLQKRDIRQVNGVWVADLTRQIEVGDERSRRRLKTAQSRRLMVLHKKLIELGFVEWAMRRSNPSPWVFEIFHSAASPKNAASKRYQRLFNAWGLSKEHEEVFHSLRHTFKDWMRAKKVEERTIALQTGHSLDGVALQYGTKILRTDEQIQISETDLVQEWDFSCYQDILNKTITLSEHSKRASKFDAVARTVSHR